MAPTKNVNAGCALLHRLNSASRSQVLTTVFCAAAWFELLQNAKVIRLSPRGRSRF